MSGIAQALLASGSLGTLSFLAYSESTAATITVPATAKAGDVGVLCQMSYMTGSLPSGGTPAGWTEITSDILSGTTRYVAACAFRVLTASDPGTSISGLDGTGGNMKLLLVFRATQPISACAALDVNTADTAPLANQTKNITGLPNPIVVIAHSVYATNQVALTPTQDARIKNSIEAQEVAYKIYNASPAEDSVASSTSGGSVAFLQSFYLTFV